MKTLSEYVSWLNSMTTTELIKEFPGRFYILSGFDTEDGIVKKMIANDAILWQLVKEYNQSHHAQFKKPAKFNDTTSEPLPDAYLATLIKRVEEEKWPNPNEAMTHYNRGLEKAIEILRSAPVDECDHKYKTFWVGTHKASEICQKCGHKK